MRVVDMVRELVGSCSSVVHAVRVMAVMALVEGIIRGGRLSPATIGRRLVGRSAAEARHQAGRPAARQSEDGRRPAVLLPGDRASPSTGVRAAGHSRRLDAGRGSTRRARGGGPDRRPSAADLHRGSPAEEARECSCREAIPVRAQGHRPERVSQRDRELTRASRDRSSRRCWTKDGIFLAVSAGRRKLSPPSERRSRRSSFTHVLRSLRSSSGRSVCS